MGRLKILLDVTVAAHVALTWLVSLDTKKRGDDAGKWIAPTPLTGVVGVTKCVRDER